jgi:subtilase family serine protease
MFRVHPTQVVSTVIVLLLSGGLARLCAQQSGRELISERTDLAKLVTLAGNTRGEANAQNDRGAVSDDLAIDHMILLLKRSPEQERAVEQLIADLHNPQSPLFHQWLTPAEFGARFGLAASDLRIITGWLESEGFTVHFVYPSGMAIDFSGNARTIRQAFHTTLHNLNVNGVAHVANFSDPRIPEALAPAVAGIVSLHDFRPHKMSRPHVRSASALAPKYTGSFNSQTYYAVGPPDLATIYDINPLFTAGITGSGQTIAVIEDTDLFTSADWMTFRSTFGLSKYTSGSLNTVHPAPATGSNNCSDPGVNADDGEAILDAEWASAAAPGAAILVAACSDTTATSGILISIQNLVNGSSPPPIISISYGGCEAESGVAQNAAYNTIYQQAVAEGISVFVAAGDEGAAGCDAGESTATHGIGVSNTASTPYNVAVGGTDYSDVYSGTTSKYWAATNSATFGSALSYIPEIPWNDSCAGSLVARYSGFATGYGPGGFCDSLVGTALQQFLFVVAAGSGGPSNCATGVPAIFGLSDGTCAGYAKPSWQTGVSGIPKDGVRDIPDVSSFAAEGNLWGHYSIVCYSDTANGGSPCDSDPGDWSGYGGTSLAAPELAGIQALVNQKVGGPQGNPNPVYYSLAASNPAVFHQVTQGDIAVNCSGATNCYGVIGNLDEGRNGRVFDTSFGGALSVSSTSFADAYSAGAAWNLANGLGSVDANNLVNSWPKK